MRFNNKISKIILIAVSGIILAIPYIYPDLFILEWFALVPFLYAVKGLSKWRSFFAGLILGILFYLISLYWITTTVYEYGGLAWIVSFLINLLLAVYLALYFAFFAFLLSVFRAYSSNHAKTIMLSALSWVVLEYLRSFMLSGFPWNLTAYSQQKFLPIIQICDIGGPYILSFLIILVNLVLFSMLETRMKFNNKQHLLLTTGTVFILVLTVFYGIYRINAEYGDKEITGSVIQGNTSMRGRWDYDECRDNLAKHEKMAAEAARKNAKIVVISESGIRCFTYRANSSLAQELRRAAQSTGSDLLFGMGSFKGVGPEAKYYNSAVLSRYDGESDQIYHKQHLVPFGEYIPFRSILKFINKFSKFYIGDTTPGDGPQLMQLSGGTLFGTAICYEVLFPDLMRKFAANGAEFLVHITNDTWYGDSAMPWQHLTLAVFRAVESRKWVLRSANSGYSGIISPTGKIIAKSELFRQDVIVGNFRPNQIQTIYTRYGDWFAILSIVIVAGFIITIIHKRRVERLKSQLLSGRET